MTALVKHAGHAVTWGAIPEPVRREVAALEAIMREIARAPKVRPAVRAIAERQAHVPGRSVQTLLRHWYAWAAAEAAAPGAGREALVDHRRCGGCGLGGCTWAESRTVTPALSQETVSYWASLNIGNDKAAQREAWRVLLRGLEAGEHVPGLGTWRDVWHRARPFAEPPETCPWSVQRPPPGLSLSAFMSRRPASVVRLLGKKGSFAAWSELPEVRVDLTGLRPFEWLVVDDHRLDFLVYVDTPSGVQLVELWGLFVMDVATRALLSFGLKPRVQREDGTSMAFEHRDMQHLIANVHGTYGVPTYGTTWIVENAAAAVSTETEALLHTVSNGLIKVKRSGIQVGDMKLSGFPERWGNYRGKRWIEAWFSPLDIVLGGVKGQMGSDYWAKPGDFDARKAFGNRLIRFVERHGRDERLRSALPFEWAGDAHQLVADAIELLNHRTDHQLAGFDEVRFFAFAPGAPVVPLHEGLATLHGHSDALAAWRAVPASVQEQWLAHGGKPRRMSPAERLALWHAGDGRDVMQPMQRAAFVDLYFDRVSKTPKGEPLTWLPGGVCDIALRRGRRSEVLRLHGALPGVEIGTRIIARMDTSRPQAGAWITDERGVFLGHLQARGAPAHDDIEGIQRELGAKIKGLGEVKRAVQRITLGHGVGAARLQAMEALTEAVHSVAGVPRQPLAETAEPTLLDEVSQTRTRRPDGRKPRYQGGARARNTAPPEEGDENSFSWD